MAIYESDLPGVGKKFEIELDDGETLVIVIHNTGKREVFHREGEADSVKLFELSDKMARQVGSILEGAYFQPIATDTSETMLDENSLLEWVKVVEGSELVGQTLETLDFRNVTGASVVSIQRDDETESNPGPNTVIEADDTLIILGTREACRQVESLASGETSIEDDIDEGDT
ncbi:MAG: TrkA C-terminal domain-containing protein [Natronomonas sp.]